MKEERHARIIELINEYDIETQEELAERLLHLGFQVTQATVSRDIRELKLTKITKIDGHSKYAILEPQNKDIGSKYVRVLKDAVLSMDAAQNILVIKTISGMAMAAAAALDELNWNEIVGCVAGDDTVFCATRSTEHTRFIMEKIHKILDNLQ